MRGVAAEEPTAFQTATVAIRITAAAVAVATATVAIAPAAVAIAPAAVAVAPVTVAIATAAVATHSVAVATATAAAALAAAAEPVAAATHSVDGQGRGWEQAVISATLGKRQRATAAPLRPAPLRHPRGEGAPLGFRGSPCASGGGGLWSGGWLRARVLESHDP